MKPALIKSGNKQYLWYATFRIIIHPIGTSFLKENNLAVILNAITTSLVRLLENFFELLGNFKYMQFSSLAYYGLTLPVYMHTVSG